VKEFAKKSDFGRRSRFRAALERLAPVRTLSPEVMRYLTRVSPQSRALRQVIAPYP
jgi:hypothetical protein